MRRVYLGIAERTRPQPAEAHFGLYAEGSNVTHRKAVHSDPVA